MNTRADSAVGPATVAIVGCGFSGTMVAVHLARQGPDSPRVLLFERDERLARGVAYGTSSPEHLLNVPARLMSAFPDEPDHFLNWLRDRDPAVQPGAFVSRRVYGDYLADLLHDAARRPGSKLAAIRAEIVDVIDEASGSFSLVTSQGTRFQADAVVVAVGNPGPQDPIPVPDRARATRSYIGNPWVDDPFLGLKADDPILLIGSGLTAIDLLVEAESRKTAGTITAISRHGLLPQPHAPAAAIPIPTLRTAARPTMHHAGHAQESPPGGQADRAGRGRLAVGDRRLTPRASAPLEIPRRSRERAVPPARCRLLGCSPPSRRPANSRDRPACPPGRKVLPGGGTDSSGA